MQKQSYPVGEGGGRKKFEDWERGVKTFRTGGLPIWGYFCMGGGGQYPITCHVQLSFSVDVDMSLDMLKEFFSDKDFDGTYYS